VASTYNPRDYVQDYGWIAQAGSQIAAGVGGAIKNMPQFREHKVKTGELYSGVQKHVYKMPDKAVHDIGTTKAELAKLVPKPEKNEDPRSYTKRISEWYKPITSRLEAIGISKQDLISMIPMGADIGTLGKEAAQESRTAQLGQAAQGALGAQFKGQEPSQQLSADVGLQRETAPGGEPSRSQQLGLSAPPTMQPQMATAGEARTRPEAQQRIATTLGQQGATPQEIRQQQLALGGALPEQAPSPDDALMADVKTKGGMTSALGANTYIFGKTEELGRSEAKAKGVKKVLDQVSKDPMILSDPKKRQKLIAEAKPLGLWDNDGGLASKETMLEILTSEEENVERLKGDVKAAEEQKNQAVHGKTKQPTPKTATPKSAPAAEATLSTIVNRELGNIFPNDVEFSKDDFGRIQRVVKPNTMAAQIAGDVELLNAFRYIVAKENARAARIPQPTPEAIERVKAMMGGGKGEGF